MMASRAADVEAVQAARDDRLVPGFEAELRRELRRAGGGGAPQVPLPAGPHTFQRYDAWQRPGLSPPPGEALKLLHRCGLRGGGTSCGGAWPQRRCRLFTAGRLCALRVFEQGSTAVLAGRQACCLCVACPVDYAGWQPTRASWG